MTALPPPSARRCPTCARLFEDCVCTGHTAGPTTR